MTDELLTPVLTNLGLSAIISAQLKGFNAKITHVAVGDGDQGNGPEGYVADKSMVGLHNEINRIVIDGGELIGQDQTQLHLTAVINDNGSTFPTTSYEIYEIGFFLESGELFAIYSAENGKIAEKVIGTDFIMMFDITVSGAGAENIVIDGSSTLPLSLGKDNLLLGPNTVKIHTQQEFDVLFNSGNDEIKIVAENTTIVLSPIQGTFEENDSGQWQKIVLGNPDGNNVAITSFSQSEINIGTHTKVHSPANGLNNGDKIEIINSHYYSYIFIVVNVSENEFDIPTPYHQGVLDNGAWGGMGNEPQHTYNGRPAYILKNSINLSANTSIIGFNAQDTLIVKDKADIQINLIGNDTNKITGVTLAGWSFDGRGNVESLGGTFLGGTLSGTNDGGAFYLDHAENCQLNCHIINHKTTGNGGGIYCVSDECKYITAEHLISNFATEGSGAYGGTFSSYKFINCQGNELNQGINVVDHHNMTIAGDLTVNGTANLPAASESLKGIVKFADFDIEAEKDSDVLAISSKTLKQALEQFSIKIEGNKRIGLNTVHHYTVEAANAVSYQWSSDNLDILYGENSASVTINANETDSTLNVVITTSDNTTINRSIDIKVLMIKKIFEPTGVIQEWQVPAGVENVSIEAWGAQGGNNNWNPGGYGVYMKGNFPVTGGDSIKIVVGEKAANVYSYVAGGGGGSFVWLESEPEPLIVAGGGGGGGGESNGSEHATLNQNGNSGQSGNEHFKVGTGGIAGQGGNEGTGGHGAGHAAGGAGWASDGEGTYLGQSKDNGDTSFKGGTGGEGNGGFGGGGGVDKSGGGGGGGYSGGGGGGWSTVEPYQNSPGGGGGSYSADNAQNVISSEGIRTGNGQVIISW